MAARTKEYFWRGPVRSAAQAGWITSTVGWIFVGLGSVDLLPLIEGGGLNPRAHTVSVVVAFLLIAPGVLLLTTKARAAAIATLCIAILMTVLGVVLAFSLAGAAGSAGIPIIIGAMAVSAILLTACWRALKATQELHRAKAHARSVKVGAEAFD